MSAMNDVDWDFLDSLHPDVASNILTRLDDPGDIVRASSVSRAWHNIVIANRVCKNLCIRLFPHLSGISDVVDYPQQQKCSDVGSSRSAEMETLKKEHRVFAALSRGLTSSVVGSLLSEAISFSRTYNCPEETYWYPEALETQTYKLISDFCVITSINIQPYEAHYQWGSRIYSSKTVRFRMGYRVLPDSEEEEKGFLKGHDALSSADARFVWTYTSEIFPMAQGRVQHFKLPEPVLCIGGIIQIEFLGRVLRQEMDGLFHRNAPYVQVKGSTLAPVFIVIPVEPSGKFSLKFNPQV